MTYSTFRPWANEIGGTTAITFALMALPIFAVCGLAVDASRQVSVKKHAQEAVDAAALAGARTFKSSFDKTIAETQATNSFAENVSTAHGDADCYITTLTVNVDDLTVRIEASCDIPTLFGVGVSGKSEVTAAVVSQATASHKIADVAMMFDVSGSMNATELGHLKVAGKRAAQIIIGTQSGERGRVSVVPFASGINAGDFGNLASGRWTGVDPEGDDSYGFGAGTTSDRVCVTERLGTEKHTDASPTAGQHVGPPTTTSQAFANADYIRASFYSCPNSPVHPLDSDLVSVNDAIDALQRSPAINGSNTAGQMGVAWSWYTISPNWSRVWTASTYGGHSRHDPHPYGDPAIEKVAILMTDGIFQYGFNGEFADFDQDEQETKSVAAAEAICTNMRAAGVTIYTVGYATSTEAETMLTNCAGGSDNAFFTTSSADLEDIYEKIAGRYLGVGLTE